MIKELHKWFFDALHRKAKYNRWLGKKAWNRFPQQPVWTAEDTRLLVELQKVGIISTFLQARTPVGDEKEVKPLKVSFNHIEKMHGDMKR